MKRLRIEDVCYPIDTAHQAASLVREWAARESLAAYGQEEDREHDALVGVLELVAHVLERCASV